jgi:asparaginyl-tRNA synthetase
MSLLGRFDELSNDDSLFSGQADLVPPPYNPETYYKDIATHLYFKALIVLRHHLKRATDDYMSQTVQAKNVDLFMMTPSVSSPMGPGSDSEAIPIHFGTLKTYLVDSSQFGFEPLLLLGLKKVYCYLPSLRGEDPDARHLNQFFHAEAEISGDLNELLPLIEGYVRYLSQTLLSLPVICGSLSGNSEATTVALTRIVESVNFPRITFDEAAILLAKLHCFKFFWTNHYN